MTDRLGVIDGYFGDYKTVATYNETRVKNILNDPRMIRNEKKIRGCLWNARIFEKVVKDHGSFRAYVDSFQPKASQEHVLGLREDLRERFKGLGPITSFHFLTDIGMPVLKPDRVICRVFYRLGLIERREPLDDNLLLRVQKQGTLFAQAANQPIRYIDIIFVAFGQVESKEYGLDQGICLEDKPRCNLCAVTTYCQHTTQNSNDNAKIGGEPNEHA